MPVAAGLALVRAFAAVVDAEKAWFEAATAVFDEKAARG
jgi:hypothetical protein